jgi:4-hydroxymandelate oxidase
MPAALHPLSDIPADIAAVMDYREYARLRVDPAVWAYLDSGGADEHTVRANREAYSRISLQSRVLRPMRGAHTRLSLFGREYDHPILIAPTAYHRLAHTEGERACALGAAATCTTMVVSAQASVSLSELAAAARPPALWFQIYAQYRREDTQALIRRAEAAGCEALVLTVDAAVNGVRNHEQRLGFRLPAHIEAVNLLGMAPPPLRKPLPGEGPLFGNGLLDHAPCWQDIAWLRAQTTMPLLLKGLMNPLDARLALEHGVDGIIVSNHGGRCLDTLPATIDALPHIAQAIRGRIPILLDGGIRRGTDILKALALGAQAVLVGRPILYGLAAAGAPGVAHVLQLLRGELEVAMALTGCRTLADIDRSIIWPPAISPAP